MKDPAAVVAELREIETARGRLDRHANDPKPPRPDYTLDSLRVPILEEQARARPVTLVERAVAWLRARRPTPGGGVQHAGDIWRRLSDSE